jgi:hypothetical protein
MIRKSEQRLAEKIMPNTRLRATTSKAARN